jgi:predicted O-linked N-acetylglucosamine transferase (SPINDLY family)
MTLDEVCDKAREFQRAGRPELAAQLYEAVLQSKPTHAAANHGVGMLKIHAQHAAESLSFLRAAVTGQPQVHGYWIDYLDALLAAGLAREAGETLALGRQQGLAGAAVEEFAQRLTAAELPPAPVERMTPASLAQPTLATPATATSATSATPILERRPPVRHATSAARRLREDPSLVPMKKLRALLKRGRTAKALVQARLLTQRFPELAAGWKTLGLLLWDEGLSEEALVPLQTAARLLPKDAETYSCLGRALVKLKAIDAAEPALKHALELDPGIAEAHYSLAHVYMKQGRFVAAQASARTAVALNPSYFTSEGVTAHSDLLFLMSHDPTVDADAFFLEHCRFGELFEADLRDSWPQHANQRDPDRCLKVAFVSGDLCQHPMANFIEPVLVRLARYATVELHAYYTNPIEDEVTLRLRAHFGHWHPVSSLTSIALAKLILDEGIDILIDLSGHTAMNRLRAFARKPAPIQVSWCGYPGTTGLRAMDYYLADRMFVPNDPFERHFTEKLAYLPASALFQPFEMAPDVNALPALAGGALTFGSFNRLGKLNAATLQLWTELLHRLPSSNLIVAGIDQQARINELIERFADYGIARTRLAFQPRCGMEAYLELYYRVDLCLDTTPYSGGTTSFHALWMGVPTLTLAGTTPAGRQGAAIMGHHALDGFVATNAADFTAKGIYWANHLHELAGLRAALRERCRRSVYQQPDLMVAELERALRNMWRRWCAGLPTESFGPTARE